MENTLYIIVPCYNEEAALPESLTVLRIRLRSMIEGGLVSPNRRIMLVSDGSTDRTNEYVESYSSAFDDVCGVILAKNRGHQNAVTTGIVCALRRGAEAILSIDADLQDDPCAMDEMAEKWLKGADIVCGVRSQRSTDRFLKRFTAHFYYRFANLFGAKLIYDHADFRLMSKKACEKLLCYGTDDLFLRGLITRLGLPLEKVYYERRAREQGESKYTLGKMFALAAKGFEINRCKPAETMQIGELYIEKEVG